jgi:hypothetical protein
MNELQNWRTYKTKKMLLLQNNFHSTNSYSDAVYYFINRIESRGYTCEPIEYKTLKEDELNPMILAYAQKSFAQDWDVNDIEQNKYWDSF